MKLEEIIKVIDGNLICGEDNLDNDYSSVFASDFMSDVLAFVVDEQILVTGMLNPQVVRSAQMMDMKCIVFIRGKQPTDEIVRLAQFNGMTILTTQKDMYNCCGLLYEAGLKGK